MVPCKSTAEEVSFEWSHHRISPTDSKVRITLQSPLLTLHGSERVMHCSQTHVPVFNNSLSLNKENHTHD